MVVNTREKNERKDIASFQIANGGERRHVMCVGARSGSNPGPLGSEPSALTNCASCQLVNTRQFAAGSLLVELRQFAAEILLVAQHISSDPNALDLSAELAEKFDNKECLHQIRSLVLWS